MTEPRARDALLAALPLGAGGALYLLGRPGHLRMFAWVEALGLSGAVRAAREVAFPWLAGFPPWLRYSLPTALWALSFTLGMVLLWSRRLDRHSAPWIGLALLCGPGWELLQAPGLLPGTFDAMDLATLTVAALIGLLPLRLRARPASAPAS